MPALTQLGCHLALTAVGCKRILVDCNYLEQLNRDNVELVIDPIAKFTETGIVTKDKATGAEKDAFQYDVIIWATGWGSISFGRSFPVYGKNGVELWEHWHKVGNPRSYLGAMCNGFPNMILGPGPSGNAFTSYIEVLEQNVDFLIKCLQGRFDLEECSLGLSLGRRY